MDLKSLVHHARFQWALRCVLIVALSFGMYTALRGLHTDDIVDALRSAKLWPLGLAVFFNFVNIFCKAGCWQRLLAPEYKIRVWTIFRYAVISAGISVVTPLRAGEALRIWLLRQKHNVPVMQGARVALWEKGLDAISLFLLLSPLPWLLPTVPAWTGQALKTTWILLLAFGLAALTSRKLPWPKNVRRAAQSLRCPASKWFPGILWITVSWLADLALIACVFYALNIHLPVTAGLFVLLVVNVAIAVPATPGQIGVLEWAAMQALMLLQIGQQWALAFALLYHAVQIVPLLVYLLLDIRFVHRCMHRLPKKDVSFAPSALS